MTDEGVLKSKAWRIASCTSRNVNVNVNVNANRVAHTWMRSKSTLNYVAAAANYAAQSSALYPYYDSVAICTHRMQCNAVQYTTDTC